MDGIVNVAFSEPFTLQSLATGQAFTRTASFFNGSSTVFAPTFAEIGNGAYRYTYTPTLAGIYEWIGSATNGEIVTIAFRVLSSAQFDPVTYLGLTAALVANLSYIRPNAITIVSTAVSDDLDVIRGDTFTGSLTITDTDGSVYDLTGATVWLTIKRANDRSSDDTDALVKLYWVDGGASSGIAVATPTSGVIAITIPAASTDLLIPGQGYRYDVQVLKAGTVGTPKRGEVNVVFDTTRRLTTP